jgi:hypothetical protein
MRPGSTYLLALAVLPVAVLAPVPVAALSSYPTSAQDDPGSSTGAASVALGVPDYRFVNDAGLAYGGTNTDVFGPGESTVLAFPVPIRNVAGQADLLVSVFVGGSGATDSAQVRVDVSSDGSSFQTVATFDTPQARTSGFGFPTQELAFEGVKHFPIELGTADLVTHVRLTNLSGTSEGLRLDAVEGLHPAVASGHAFEVRFERYRLDSTERFFVRLKNLGQPGAAPLREFRMIKPVSPPTNLEETRRSVFGLFGLVQPAPTPTPQLLCVENCIPDNGPDIPFSRHVWSLDGVVAAPAGAGLDPGRQAGNRRDQSFDIDSGGHTWLAGFSFEVVFVDGYVHAFDYNGEVLGQAARGALFQKYEYFSTTPENVGPRPADWYEFVGPAFCADGIDQDGDGGVDYPEDPGCESSDDASEKSPGLPCDDGLDNDGDGLVDFPADAGCTSLLAGSEVPLCEDGADNDGDGLADFPADLGCSSAFDATETSPALTCDDGTDNDGDGQVDWPNDPGCLGQFSPREDPACDNGADDDGDGLADWPADPGCAAAWGGLENPQCNDGLDNDGDGQIDLADPGCAGAPSRNRESGGICGLGFELALVVPILDRLRRRARRPA